MVRLTDEGARLLEYADRVLADVDLVVAEADALRGVVRGKVAVGMMECPPASLDMAVLLSEFHADHPGVEVALRSGGSDRMLEDVRAGDLDFAILGLPPTPLDDRLTARTLLVEDLVGLVEVDHRLRTRARAASLAEEVFVDFPPGYGLREQTDHCFAEAGIDRKVGFEVVRVEEMIRFATLGLGIAVLPRSIAAAIGRRARRPRTVDITGADLRRTVALVHRAGRPPLRRRLRLLRPRRSAASRAGVVRAPAAWFAAAAAVRVASRASRGGPGRLWPPRDARDVRVSPGSPQVRHVRHPSVRPGC